VKRAADLFGKIMRRGTTSAMRLDRLIPDSMLGVGIRLILRRCRKSSEFTEVYAGLRAQ